jgi:transposase
VRLPVEAVDVIIPVKPARCPRCQHALQGEDPLPPRHQVTEIPAIKPVVTEYLLHRPVCPACGEAIRAELPAGVPSGGFGPRVQAITALCPGAYHLSKRTTQNVMEDLFGVLLGLGTVATWSRRRPRRWQPPWSRRGPMYGPSRRRMPMKRGGGKGSNGPGCGRSSRLG